MAFPFFIISCVCVLSVLWSIIRCILWILRLITCFHTHTHARIHFQCSLLIGFLVVVKHIIHESYSTRCATVANLFSRGIYIITKHVIKLTTYIYFAVLLQCFVYYIYIYPTQLFFSLFLVLCYWPLSLVYVRWRGFCYWPPGCWFSSLVKENWIE
jgi:hypothetical protein